MNINQLLTTLNQFQPTLTNRNINWTLPVDLSHGILTTNLAFTLAKELKQNPNAIAGTIVGELSIFLNNSNLNLEAKQIGPYINLIPNNDFYSSILTQSLDKENLVQTSNQKFILDYIAANVAKKLSIGNMRNCNIGDSIRRILMLKYPNLVTDNHWGDWGVNMGILIWGWKVFDHTTFEASKIMIDKLTRIYVWANAQKEVVEDWDNLVRQEFLKLEQKDPTNFALWQNFVITTKQDLRLDLDLMGVPKHDIEQGESYYEADMALLTEFMEKNNLWIADNKARYFDFEIMSQNWQGISEEFRSKVAGFGRCYLISSTGYTSYCYRDVATKLQYARDLKADLALVVTDKTQKHNFDQAFSIIYYLASLPEFVAQFGQETADRIIHQNMRHLGYGFLKLESGKMSARKGNVILLRDLVRDVELEAKRIILAKTPNTDLELIEQKAHKVALSAIKWNDLKQSYEQDITFDINQVLNFTGNTGVYQLYTYVRLNSVLKRLKQVDLESTLTQKNLESITLNKSPLSGGKGVQIINPIEQSILSQMFTLPIVLESITGNYQIHLLTNHLYELSNLVNKWYNDVPILKDKDRKEFFVVFVTKVMTHLEFCLDLLGIEVVEEL